MAPVPSQATNTYRSEARKLLTAHLEKHWPSQAELARALKVSPRTVSHWLAGRLQPDLQTAIRIQLVTEKKGKPVVRCLDWREG